MKEDHTSLISKSIWLDFWKKSRRILLFERTFRYSCWLFIYLLFAQCIVEGLRRIIHISSCWWCLVHRLKLIWEGVKDKCQHWNRPFFYHWNKVKLTIFEARYLDNQWLFLNWKSLIPNQEGLNDHYQKEYLNFMHSSKRYQGEKSVPKPAPYFLVGIGKLVVGKRVSQKKHSLSLTRIPTILYHTHHTSYI